MSRQITYTETLSTIVCAECGMQFAVPLDWENARRNDDNGFHCPNGHPLHFKSENARLKRELAAAERREQELRARMELDRKEREKAAKRAKAGVCPCCHRSFVQMARHMKAKHPAYAP